MRRVGVVECNSGKIEVVGGGWCERKKIRRVGGGSCNVGTIEVVGGGGCEMESGFDTEEGGRVVVFEYWFLSVSVLILIGARTSGMFNCD